MNELAFTKEQAIAACANNYRITIEEATELVGDDWDMIPPSWLEDMNKATP